MQMLRQIYGSGGRGMKLPNNFDLEIESGCCVAELNEKGNYIINENEYAPPYVRDKLKDRIWKLILPDEFEFINQMNNVCTAKKYNDKYLIGLKGQSSSIRIFYSEVYTYVLEGKWSILDNPEEELDIINKPSHYHKNEIDVNGYLEKHFPKEGEFTVSEGFYIGNALKYISRYKYKNGLEDLEKAAYYLGKLIDIEKGNLPL
jgi:Protein of unknwon function (DUF3310)